MSYLDWAAGAPPDEHAHTDAAALVSRIYANPSSIHEPGREARDRVEDARNRIARTLKTTSDRIVFTSGATEANNIVLSSFLLRKTSGSVVVPEFEHDSVFEPALLLSRSGIDVRFIRADGSGRFDATSIAEAIDTNTACVCLMHVHNVTGAIQPLGDIIPVIRNRPRGERIHIHVDAAQSVGRFSFEPESLDIDSASMSGVKFGAPHGSGILYCRRRFEPVYRGGNQESGLRPGTENLYAIWGMMLALEHSFASPTANLDHAIAIKRMVVRSIGEIHGADIIHGPEVTDPEAYSPYLIAVAIPPIPSEVLLRVLSDRGYSISNGSACSAKKKHDNRVLLSFGCSERVASSTIRVSWGPSTQYEEIEAFCDVLKSSVDLLKRNISR